MSSSGQRSHVMGLVVAALVALAVVSLTVACGSSAASAPTVLSHPSASPSTGRLTSAPFTANGSVRVIGDFAAQSGNYGVGGVLVPPNRAHEGVKMLLREPTFIVAPSAPSDTVHGVSGRLVIVVNVPTTLTWSLSVRAGK
jgi:hypothetical protein